MIFAFQLELVTVCGAGHLQASEGEVLWGSKNEAGRIPVLLCLIGTVGVHYEILPEF